MNARVIVLAGPSGAGKTRLAARLGLPVLRLDDFYRDLDDPAVPRLADGLVDWDDVRSWCRADAVAALQEVCAAGRCRVPDYDIATSRRRGGRELDLDGADFVIAEGIFAPVIVRDLDQAGVLAAAICLTQHPALTFFRRLVRDLREHRKSPAVLLRRGLRLARAQSAVVDDAVARGCVAMGAPQAEAHLRALVSP